MSGPTATGPVLIAYDGSDLAALAIDEAGSLLGAGNPALVLCVWQPFDVGFVPAGGEQFDAAGAKDVKAAAEHTAAAGADRARAAGFDASSASVEAAPTWRGIVDVANERDARLIVLGSHGRSGVRSMFYGSVASAVLAHSRRTVLISHVGD